MPTLTSNNVKVKITTESDISEIKKTQQALDAFEKSQDSNSKSASLLGGAMKAGAVAVAALGAATATAGVSAIKSAAGFEQTRIGLENMLGSADAAKSLLSDISKFAADTPFEFPELASATKQLVAFGFTGKDAFKTMTQLGDVSAAIGAPIGDLAYLMGTLRTQGRAFTVDIRQFAQRGVPIYEYLAQVLHTNTNELSGMIEAGKVGFPEVQKAFELMTSEGGKFHGAMAKQSKSLAGLWSTLSDNIGQAGRELIGINQNGDIVAGSIFDKLRLSIGKLIEVLPTMLANFKQTVSDVTAKVGEFADKVGDYLGPKVIALGNTIRDKIMPLLSELWHNVLEPLIPVIGTTLVVALGLAIDAFNLIFNGISWVVQAMKDGNPIIWMLASAFGGLAAAMAFNAVFNAINVGFNTLRLITIPSMIASVEAMQAVILAPLVMPAIAVAAAIGALIAVKNAANDARAAVDNAQRAADNAVTSQQSSLKTLQNLAQHGTAEQQKRAKTAIANMAANGSFATGGYTGPGGTNEVAGVVHKGEYVIPKAQVNQSTGQPKAGATGGGNTFIIQNLHLPGVTDRKSFITSLDADTLLAGRGLTPNLGIR
jgi:hypothetical protein